MRKLEKEEYEDIEGGSFIGILTGVIQLTQTVAAVSKMMTSESGTFKTSKDTSFTWKGGKTDVNVLLPKMYDA